MKSKSLPERIALIEFDSSHDECLLTQINALKKRNCWIMLVTNETVRSRNQYLENVVDEWLDIDPRDSKRKGLTGAAIGDAMIIRRLMRTLKKERIDRAVFNTAQGGHVRNACLFSLFRRIEFIGIIHTIRKFQGSFTQRLISLKIKKYFVLGEFLNEQIRLKKKIEINSFYPIDFPNLEREIESIHAPHIALIGSVETRRKDLDGFISLIQQCYPDVRFSFLGKADPTNPEVIQFKEKLAEINCLDRVEFFDNYVNFEIVGQFLRKSSAVLPLVHPNTRSAKEYFHHQIPGAMNVALGYKIPLLLHESFRKIEELKTAAIYYELSSFSSALNELSSNGKTIREKMKIHKTYRSEFQYKKYLDFIFAEHHLPNDSYSE